MWVHEPWYTPFETTATSGKMAASSVRGPHDQEGCLNGQYGHHTRQDGHRTASPSAPKIRVQWAPKAPLQLDSKQNELIVKL